MDDIGQLISVSIEGMKFTFEASKETIEMILKGLLALKASAILTTKTAVKSSIKTVEAPFKVFNFLKYRKDAGATNRSNFLLKSSGPAVNYAVEKEQYQLLKKYAKKTGLLFYEMADFSKNLDGKVHIMFSQEATPNFEAAISMANEELKKKYRKSGKHAEQHDYSAGQNETAFMPEKETFSDYIRRSGMADMSLDEVFNQLMNRMETEEQKDELRQFFGETQKELSRQASDIQEEQNEKTKDAKTSETINEPDTVQEFEGESLGEDIGEKDNAVKTHATEISEAVKENNFQSMVNRSDMVYIEADESCIFKAYEEPDMLILATADRENVVRIPRESVLVDKLESGSSKRLVVLKKDATYKNVFDQEMLPADIKKIFNAKDEHGKYTYSETFRKLFKTDDKTEHRPLSDNKKSTEKEYKAFPPNQTKGSGKEARKAITSSRKAERRA